MHYAVMGGVMGVAVRGGRALRGRCRCDGGRSKGGGVHDAGGVGVMGVAVGGFVS